MGEVLANASLEEFCNHLRRLASDCLTVERWLGADRASITSQQEAGPSPTLVGSALDRICRPTSPSGLFPETRRISALACELRRSCDQLVDDLRDGARADIQPGVRQRTILVVDDTADTCELLTLILGQAGFAVVTASNGLEGLIAAHQIRPSLILMDVQMPILDGIQATRLLKSTEATRHIPVIAHTARPASCHVPPGVLFAHVLPKPVIPDVLLALTQRFVGSGEGAT
jgi:CheY-like chemotaxis protein